MDSSQHVVVVGGGIFGLTNAIILGERGHRVTLIEKSVDLMRGASFANQNRIHMGYHYPRSPETIRSSLASLESFNEYFGDSIVSDFDKYYAIGKPDSMSTVEQFVQVCQDWQIPLKEAWPDPELLDRDMVEACWITPETIYDYHALRRISIERARRHGQTRFLRNVTITGIDPGPPHRVTLSDGEIIECDFVVNTAYAGLTDFINLLSGTQHRFQFELCIMPIMEADHMPPRRYGITVMDGRFCSLMPRGSYHNQFILAHVGHTPNQAYVGTEAPRWSRMEGFPEIALIEASQLYFPVLAQMHWRESWITTKIILPDRDHDDARPSLILNHAPSIYSVFSGKLTTCVTAAREILRYVEAS